jgi:hypothetical protein
MLPARMFRGVPAEVVVGKGKRNIPSYRRQIIGRRNTDLQLHNAGWMNSHALVFRQVPPQSNK